GADVRPDAEGGGADRGQGLGDDAQAAGEGGPADGADAVVALDQGSGTGDGPRLRRGAGRRLGARGRHLSASSFFSSEPLSDSPSMTGIRESLPRESISAISTWTFWPTPSTSSTFSTRLPPAGLRICEMCSRPSLPGSRETKAPKVVVFTTVPRERAPTSGIAGAATTAADARSS